MAPDCPDCETPLIEFDLLSGIFHCSNPECGFIYFDKNTGKKYRKNEGKSLPPV